MAKFYSEFGRTSNVCAEAAEAFSGLLGSLRSSGKRAIKVLEFGAGLFLSVDLNEESDIFFQERGC
jgi:hypothetical protein